MITAWRSYVPTHVVEDLAAHPHSSPVGREQRFLAVALFADVAGFTPISEALARSGRAGAEELTTILNGYFTPMIELVRGYGGSVVKFGGDAMTVLFRYDSASQPATVRRAIACALQMQAAMTRYSAIATSVGTFGLSMKAGLAMGSVLCTSVGDPERQLEYIIAGTLLDRCAEAEHLAARGEIVVHNPLLALASSVTVAEPRGAYSCIGALANAPLPIPPAAEPTPALIAPLLARYLHPSIAERLQAGLDSFVSEHRKVTVLFMHFAGFDYDNDPEVVAGLQRFAAAVLALVARYDGYLSRVDMGDKGSKCLILFGAPIIHEDDEERALRCALDLIALPGVQARIGVNTGFVFCGAVGSDIRREYTVMGDPVNLAARLMQAAATGQVLVGQATYARVAERFAWQHLDPISVKGKTEPLTIFGLHGILRQPTLRLLEPRSYATPLLGREAELAQASAAIAAVRQRQGQVLVISGEAGMGKSRLGAAIVAHAGAEGLAVYGGACQSHGAASSYLVWRDIWRALFEIDPSWAAQTQIDWLQAGLQTLDPAMLRRLPLLGALLSLPIPDNELTTPLDPQLRSELLRALLLELLRRRLSTPTLFVLEDCQWIDPLSQQLLEFLGRGLHNLPLLLLVLQRRAEHERAPLPWMARSGGLREIRLAELPAEQTRQLLAARLAQLAGTAIAVPDALAELVIARTQGNPFYAEELISLIHSRGVDVQDAVALQALDLPASLHSLVLSRIDQLPEAAKTTLKVASVVGRVFKASWLSGSYPELGSATNVQQQLETLSSLELTPLHSLEPEPEYTFKHSTIQEVAYESIAFALRADLHERIALFIEQGYPDTSERYLDVLAFHFGRSHNQPKQRIYFRRAGDAARTAYANAAAIDYYRRLIALLPGAEQGDVLVMLGEVQQLVGAWPAAEEAYRAGLALAAQTGDRRLEAYCQSGLGSLLAYTASYAEALGWLDRARTTFAELGDYRGLSQALGQAGFAYDQQGEYDQALACATQQLEIAEANADQVSISSAIENIGLVHWSRSDYEQALEHLRQAFDQASAVDYRRGAIIAGGDIAGVYAAQGQYRLALEWLQRALALAVEIGYLQAIGFQVGNAGELYRPIGDYTQALACYGRGLQIAAGLGDWPTIIPIIGNIAIIFTAQERYTQAARLYARAVSLGRELDIPYCLCEDLYRSAELLTRQGRYAEALSLNQEALEVARQVSQTEIAFAALLLALRLRAALGQHTSRVVAELQQLLAGAEDEASEAAIHYTTWQLSADVQSGRKAARLYRSLYRRTADVEYRRRYGELTGKPLPAPPRLPPLPAELLGPPVDLDALLIQVGV